MARLRGSSGPAPLAGERQGLEVEGEALLPQVSGIGLGIGLGLGLGPARAGARARASTLDVHCEELARGELAVAVHVRR